jgi:hypothetical protein
MDVDVDLHVDVCPLLVVGSLKIVEQWERKGTQRVPKDLYSRGGASDSIAAQRSLVCRSSWSEAVTYQHSVCRRLR